MEHPSYGLIKVERVSGQVPCFLAEYEVEGYIKLTIYQAEYKFDGDYAVQGSRLVEVRMTWEQYLRLIANPDCGEGSPCTIEHIQGTDIKLHPTPNKIDTVSRDLRNHLNKIKKDGDDLENLVKALVDKGRATKKDLNELSTRLSTVLTKVNSDLTYTVSMHQESISQALENAKISLMAFASRVKNRS